MPYYMGVSDNSVPLNPMVLLIIIPIKWLFHWEYIPYFQTNPYPYAILHAILYAILYPYAIFHHIQTKICPGKICVTNEYPGIHSYSPNFLPWPRREDLAASSASCSVSVMGAASTLRSCAAPSLRAARQMGCYPRKPQKMWGKCVEKPWNPHILSYLWENMRENDLVPIPSGNLHRLRTGKSPYRTSSKYGPFCMANSQLGSIGKNSCVLSAELLSCHHHMIRWKFENTDEWWCAAIGETNWLSTCWIRLDFASNHPLWCLEAKQDTWRSHLVILSRLWQPYGFIYSAHLCLIYDQVCNLLPTKQGLLGNFLCYRRRAAARAYVPTNWGPTSWDEPPNTQWDWFQSNWFTWGALSARKKKWYSTKPTFWRSGMEKAWKNEISQFLVISDVIRFFTRFGRPFHYIIWKRQSWLKIWKRQSPKIGWYAWAKLLQQLKTGLQHISCRNKKQNTNIAEICGNIAEICGHMFQPF